MSPDGEAQSRRPEDGLEAAGVASLSQLAREIERVEGFLPDLSTLGRSIQGKAEESLGSFTPRVLPNGTVR